MATCTVRGFNLKFIPTEPQLVRPRCHTVLFPDSAPAMPDGMMLACTLMGPPGVECQLLVKGVLQVYNLNLNLPQWRQWSLIC